MRPSRRELLWSTVALGLTGLPAQAAPPAKRLVVVHCDGGWDTTFTFDPKPNLATVAGPYGDMNPDDPFDWEEIGTWGEIDVTLNGRRREGVTEFFEAWGHRTTVVRGLWVGSVSHWIGRDRILCGTERIDAPDLTAIVGSQAADRPLGMIDLSGHGRFGTHSALGARAGTRGQLRGLLLPGSRFDPAPGVARPAPLTPPRRDAVEDWLAARSAHDAALRSTDPGRVALLSARSDARRRGAALFAQGAELEPLLPSGERDLLDQVDLAVTLLAAGTCQSVLIDSTQQWDTHAGHVAQHFSHHATFSGLRLLAEGLEAHGLLDETLVVVTSEMGRTPWRNAEAGTEHWPYTGALLLGGGVAGGQAMGGTDAGLVGQPVDLVTGRLDPAGTLPRYDHLAAAILQQVGIDPGSWLPGVPPLGGLSG